MILVRAYISSLPITQFYEIQLKLALKDKIWRYNTDFPIKSDGDWEKDGSPYNKPLAVCYFSSPFT